MTISRGSSPLARGLPGRGRRAHPGRRIIPARAGFTPHQSQAQKKARDHPRSRGVYLRILVTKEPNLLDHPRSRGVYASASAEDRYWYGSSPLARGLHNAQNALISGGVDHPRSRGVYVSRS